MFKKTRQITVAFLASVLLQKMTKKRVRPKLLWFLMEMERRPSMNTYFREIMSVLYIFPYTRQRALQRQVESFGKADIHEHLLKPNNDHSVKTVYLIDNWDKQRISYGTWTAFDQSRESVHVTMRIAAQFLYPKQEVRAKSILHITADLKRASVSSQWTMFCVCVPQRHTLNIDTTTSCCSRDRGDLIINEQTNATGHAANDQKSDGDHDESCDSSIDGDADRHDFDMLAEDVANDDADRDDFCVYVDMHMCGGPAGGPVEAGSQSHSSSSGEILERYVYIVTGIHHLFFPFKPPSHVYTVSSG